MGHPDRAVIRGAQICKVKVVTTRPWRSIQIGEAPTDATVLVEPPGMRTSSLDVGARFWKVHIIERALINLDRARDHGAGGKLIAPKAASRAAKCDPQRGLADDACQRVPQLLDIPVARQQTVLLVAHGFMNAADI